MKYAFIIQKDNMGVGGIETNIAKAISGLLGTDKEIDYYWFTTDPGLLDVSFKPVFEQAKVKIIRTHKKISWFRFHVKDLPNYDKAIIISFGLYDYLRNEKIRKAFEKTTSEVVNCLFVPHFKLRDCFMEHEYGHFLYKRAFSELKEIYTFLMQSNALYFFAEKHLTTVSQTYGIDIKNPDNYLIKNSWGIPQFDEHQVRSRYQRKDFNIITISRFDFPHKGYLLGLVDAFAELYKDYPFIKLTIIGYGQDEKMLREKIGEKSDDIQMAVKIVGKVSPFNLAEYLKEADLNISVAGAVREGAINGVISLPARHYCYQCETYGFLPESASKTVSDEPGKPVVEYMKQIINYSEEEYVSKSYQSYKAYEEKLRNKMDEMYFLNLKNIRNGVFKTKWKWFIIMTNYYVKIKNVVHKITNNKSGLRKNDL